MGRGRPCKPGKRHKGGKRIKPTPFDHGADHVVRARARFARFQDGKAAQHVFDPIGRAWAVGLLENERVDPAALRDAGRDYGGRYWGYYPGAAGISNYLAEDRRGRGHEGGGLDVAGDRFRAMDRALKDAGRLAYGAVQALVVDTHWLPDEDPAWLRRLIAARIREGDAAPAAGPGDAAMLRRAIEGLLALAAGRRHSRPRPG